MNTPKSRLRSKIWLAFNINSHDSSKAICKVCGTSVSRGGNTGESKCTTNLWNHIKHKHPDLNNELHKMKNWDENSVLARENRTVPVISEPSSKVGDDFAVEILKFYKINEDSPTANCLDCGAEIFCGPGGTITTPLYAHTKSKHPESYWSAERQQRSQEKAPLSDMDYFTRYIEPRLSERGGSSVWNEFTKDPNNPCQAICKTCNTVVKRGTSIDRLNTTNLHSHLQGSIHRNMLLCKTKIESLQKELSDQNGEIDSAAWSSAVMEVISTQNDFSNDISVSNNTDSSHKQQVEKVSNRRVREPAFEHETSLIKNGPVDNGFVVKPGEVDMAHTACIMNVLYQQQKRDSCCDFSLHLPCENSSYKSPNSKISVCDNNSNIKYYESCNGYEFKLHSCVITAVSNKLKTVVDNGSKSMLLSNVSKDALSSFIEIVYTGKLRGAGSVEKRRLQDIYKTAQILSTPIVVDYLRREYPKTSFIDEPASQKVIERNHLPNSLFAIAESEKSHSGNNHVGIPQEPSLPKVNKRKNYHPVSSEWNRKRVKTEPVVEERCLSGQTVNDDESSTSALIQNGESSGEKLSSWQSSRASDQASQASYPFSDENKGSVLHPKSRPKHPNTKNSFFEVVNLLRLAAGNTFNSVDKKSPYTPDISTEKLWNNILTKKLSHDFVESSKDTYCAVASVSKRCWELLEEVVHKGNIPDKCSTWTWVSGCSELVIFYNLLRFYKCPYVVSKNLILSEAEILKKDVDGEIYHLVQNNKRCQTDVDGNEVLQKI